MEDNIVQFKPKVIKDDKKKYAGSVRISKDQQFVQVDMDDKSMMLSGTTAYDFAIVMLMAAKFVMFKKFMNVEGDSNGT